MKKMIAVIFGLILGVIPAIARDRIHFERAGDAWLCSACVYDTNADLPYNLYRNAKDLASFAEAQDWYAIFDKEYKVDFQITNHEKDEEYVGYFIVKNVMAGLRVYAGIRCKDGTFGVFDGILKKEFAQGYYDLLALTGDEMIAAIWFCQGIVNANPAKSK